MISMRFAIALVLLAPALTFGQGEANDPNKVSNDDPARPLQMPPAPTEVKEALDDFERFQRRGAWERALKALYTISEDQALRFVDGESGFIIPVARKRREVLTALPPEGQAAYRLFYDAEARKLFDEAEGAAEQANLERLYSAYFTTSVGDDAADRLGDLYFEQGRFDRAADCWLSILRDRPDTDLTPATLATKAALALFQAGRRSEFEQIRAELEDRYKDETVTLGGESGRPAESLKRILDVEPTITAAENPKTAADVSEARLELGLSVEPDWQLPVAESIEAGMTAIELNQWRSNTLSDAAPVVTIDGSRLYANYLGYVMAVDLNTGKLLWRTGAFHNLELLVNQPAVQMLSPNRFAILARGEYVWDVSRDLKDQNYMGSFSLNCRRADDGELVWKSSNLPEYALYNPTGPPILGDGKLFLAVQSQQNPQQNQPLPQQWVLAIQPHDGKLLWKTEVGVFRQGQQQYYYSGMRDSSPRSRLILNAGSLFIDTHIGVLARLDADSGRLDWGYGYQTAPAQGGMNFFYNQRPQPTPASGGPFENGDSLLIKGAQSSRLYAVDPNRMKLNWERAISKGARLLGADDRSIYLGGDELGSLDVKTRNLTWATQVPGGSLTGTVLVRADGIWQMTPRGVFEIDPQSGEVRKIFRGADLGSAGGDVLLTDGRLLTVSNRTITAYSRQADGIETAGPGDSSTLKEKTPR